MSSLFLVIPIHSPPSEKSFLRQIQQSLFLYPSTLAYLPITISMSIPVCLLTFLLFTKTHLSHSFTDPILVPQQSNTDVHDLLPQYGFPRGLIPDNVKSYSISPSGSFSIELKTPCYVHFDQLVYYDKEIKGKLSYGSVHDASGIQAKKLFIWVSVTAIEVSKEEEGMIEFFAGALSEKLPAKEFQDIPACKSKAALRANLESM